MLKSILKIDGIQKLNKTEQRSLQGGRRSTCGLKPGGLCCMNGICLPGYCVRPTTCRWY